MCGDTLNFVNGEVSPPEIIDRMGDVAELMLADLDDIVAEMNAAEIELIPALGADAVIVTEISASNRANAARLLTMFARRDGKMATVDVPPEALDLGRTVARRGIDLDAVFQGYHRGQSIVWRCYMAYAARVVPSGPLLAQLLEVSWQRIAEYVDQVVGSVLTAAQREREAMLGGALARRHETIRLVLDGAPIDARRAGEQLGYDLARRHTALVLWVEPADGGYTGLESAVAPLAQAAGARSLLTFAAGTSALWAWLGSDGEPAAEALRAAMQRVQPRVRVAVGPTRPGIDGFRRSHAAVLSVQRLLAGHPAGPRLVFYRDLEVTALAAQDCDRAVEFVAATLGPLAANTPGSAALRETLRVFLDEAENAPRAAARLHTHRNTVLQRVARATELLGYHPGEHRLAVELALELAHQIGPRVLTAPGGQDALRGR